MNDLWVRRQKEPIPFGDKPLIVISAAARFGSPSTGVSEEDWRQLNQEKVVQQADLAKLSRNSKALVAKESVHEIHIHEPQLVVDSIREVVDAVRSQRPLR
jgi:hypothetical protein